MYYWNTIFVPEPRCRAGPTTELLYEVIPEATDAKPVAGDEIELEDVRYGLEEAGTTAIARGTASEVPALAAAAPPFPGNRQIIVWDTTDA